jgi:hypothetical protein
MATLSTSTVLNDNSISSLTILNGYSISSHTVLNGYSINSHSVLNGYSIKSHTVLNGYSISSHTVLNGSLSAATQFKGSPYNRLGVRQGHSYTQIDLQQLTFVPYTSTVCQRTTALIISLVSYLKVHNVKH